MIRLSGRVSSAHHTLADGAQGHKYAIDAMVAVTAMHQPGPVVMLTSDADDMSRFCGDRVTIVAV